MPNPDNLNSPSYGNLKVLNVTRDLLTATEDDFVFTVPSGGVGQLREATYHLVRSAALGTAGTGGNTFTSELIRIKSLEVVKRGASERTNLLSGTPNIMEFGGDGSLTRMFTVIEQLENNEDIIITIRNTYDCGKFRIGIDAKGYSVVRTDLHGSLTSRDIDIRRRLIKVQRMIYAKFRKNCNDEFFCLIRNQIGCRIVLHHLGFVTITLK